MAFLPSDYLLVERNGKTYSLQGAKLAATGSRAGLVQLNSALDSQSTTSAATPLAVSQVNANALSADAKASAAQGAADQAKATASQASSEASNALVAAQAAQKDATDAQLLSKEAKQTAQDAKDQATQAQEASSSAVDTAVDAANKALTAQNAADQAQQSATDADNRAKDAQAAVASRLPYTGGTISGDLQITESLQVGRDVLGILRSKGDVVFEQSGATLNYETGDRFVFGWNAGSLNGRVNGGGRFTFNVTYAPSAKAALLHSSGGSAIDKVKQLQAVQVDSGLNGDQGDPMQALTLESVQKAMPSAVVPGAPQLKSTAETQLISLLAQALQEATARIEALEAAQSGS